MDARQFIDVLDLAATDIAGFEPELIGVILIAATREDGVSARMASDMPEPMAQAVIAMLHRARNNARPDGTPPITRVPLRLRKDI
jgi:hypothetical protein